MSVAAKAAATADGMMYNEFSNSLAWGRHLAGCANVSLLMLNRAPHALGFEYEQEYERSLLTPNS